MPMLGFIETEPKPILVNAQVNLFPTFGGPWADTPCRPQDIDFHVPHE